MVNARNDNAAHDERRCLDLVALGSLIQICKIMI